MVAACSFVLTESRWRWAAIFWVETVETRKHYIFINSFPYKITTVILIVKFKIGFNYKNEWIFFKTNSHTHAIFIRLSLQELFALLGIVGTSF